MRVVFALMCDLLKRCFLKKWKLSSKQIIFGVLLR